MFSSCEEDLIVYDTPNGYVQVNAETGSIGEGSADAFVTSVLLGAASNPNGVTVNFTVASTDPSRYIVSPSSGTIEIPAGEFSADITIQPVDNLLVDGDLDIVLTLTTDNVLPIGIGGEGINAAAQTITLVDDDCPVDINAFVGTFSVAEKFTGGANAPSGLKDFFEEAYQLEISLAPNDPTGTKIVINNSPGFDVYIPNGTVMTFQACPGTVVFDAGFPTVALFRQFVYTASEYSDGATPTIKCSGPLATFGPYEFILTKI